MLERRAALQPGKQRLPQRGPPLTRRIDTVPVMLPLANHQPASGPDGADLALLDVIGCERVAGGSRTSRSLPVTTCSLAKPPLSPLVAAMSRSSAATPGCQDS